MGGTLEEFLRDGKLDPAFYGATKEEMTVALGPPAEKSRLRNPAVWRWGALDLTFLDDRVAAIGLVWTEGRTLPEGFPWEGWKPGPATAVGNWSAWARSAHLPCAVDPALTLKTQVGLRMGPLVTVVFSRDGEVTRLESVNRQAL